MAKKQLEKKECAKKDCCKANNTERTLLHVALGFGTETLSGEAVEPFMKLAKRIEKLDQWCRVLIAEEGVENIDPQDVCQILILQARHILFSQKCDPLDALVFLTEILMHRAPEAYRVMKEMKTIIDNHKEQTKSEGKQEKQKATKGKKK